MSQFSGLPADGTIELKGGSFTVRTTDNYVWAGYNTDQTLGGYYFKAYLAFDTSSIPVGSTINSAQLTFVVDAVYSTPAGLSVPIMVQHSPWTLPLSSDDWDTVNPPSGSVDGSVVVVPHGVTGYSCVVQVTNVSVVVPGDITTFRLVLAELPQGATRLYARIWSGNSGTKPVLSVTYTPPVSLTPTVTFPIEGIFEAILPSSDTVDVRSTMLLEGLLTCTTSNLITLPEVTLSLEGLLSIFTDTQFTWYNSLFELEGLLAATSSSAEGMLVTATAEMEGVLTVVPDEVSDVAAHAYMNLEGLVLFIDERERPGNVDPFTFTTEGLLEFIGHTIVAPPTGSVRVSMALEGFLWVETQGPPQTTQVVITPSRVYDVLGSLNLVVNIPTKVIPSTYVTVSTGGSARLEVLRGIYVSIVIVTGASVTELGKYSDNDVRASIYITVVPSVGGL